MKLIVITKPTLFKGEARQLMKLLDNSVDYIHIRKPTSASNEVAHLLEQIPESYHTKIKLHYYKDLLPKHPLMTFHHSSGSNLTQEGAPNQTKSTHDIQALKKRTAYQYQFISPVFDSISKKGYKAKFKLETLTKYLKENRVKNVVALGGINTNNIHLIRSLPLYGVALLGAVWNDSAEADMQCIKSIKEQLS